MGRTQRDNQRIAALHTPNRETTLKAKDFPGPFVALRGRPSAEILHKAAAICAGYSKASREPVAEVLVSGPDGEQVLKVKPLRPEDAHTLIV